MFPPPPPQICSKSNSGLIQDTVSAPQPSLICGALNIVQWKCRNFPSVHSLRCTHGFAFLPGPEPPTPSSERCWSIPMTHVAHGAYWELLLSPVTPCCKVLLLTPPQPPRFGDEELWRLAARPTVTLGRLWWKEELSCIPGHYPDSWICPLTALQPFLILSCFTCSPEIIWLFELGEMGSRYTRVSSWVRLLSNSNSSSSCCRSPMSCLPPPII